jgi:hypothetical protein
VISDVCGIRCFLAVIPAHAGIQFFLLTSFRRLSTAELVKPESSSFSGKPEPNFLLTFLAGGRRKELDSGFRRNDELLFFGLLASPLYR